MGNEYLLLDFHLPSHNICVKIKLTCSFADIRSFNTFTFTVLGLKNIWQFPTSAYTAQQTKFVLTQESLQWTPYVANDPFLNVPESRD